MSVCVCMSACKDVAETRFAGAVREEEEEEDLTPWRQWDEKEENMDARGEAVSVQKIYQVRR